MFVCLSELLFVSLYCGPGVAGISKGDTVFVCQNYCLSVCTVVLVLQASVRVIQCLSVCQNCCLSVCTVVLVLQASVRAIQCLSVRTAVCQSVLCCRHQ